METRESVASESRRYGDCCLASWMISGQGDHCVLRTLERKWPSCQKPALLCWVCEWTTQEMDPLVRFSLNDCRPSWFLYRSLTRSLSQNQPAKPLLQIDLWQKINTSWCIQLLSFRRFCYTETGTTKVGYQERPCRKRLLGNNYALLLLSYKLMCLRLSYFPSLVSQTGLLTQAWPFGVLWWLWLGHKGAHGPDPSAETQCYTIQLHLWEYWDMPLQVLCKHHTASTDKSTWHGLLYTGLCAVGWGPPSYVWSETAHGFTFFHNAMTKCLS